MQGENDIARLSNKPIFINKNDSYQNIKKGIWIYFILIVFEGALRKWVLPGLATPLLLIRDPVAIWLIIAAWKKGVFIFNTYVIIIFIIGIVGLFTAVFLGHGNALVAIYGVRTLVLHFPLIFVIGNVFNREDVLKIGRCMVWLTIPMTVLLVLQFYSPQGAWVNRGIGGDTEGGGFAGALGFFRPPATFSFTNGTALFYSLAACFIFYFWLVPQVQIKKSILICASIALLMSIPLSISRTLFFSIIITLGFVVLATFVNRKSILRVMLVGILVIGIFLVLSQTSTFHTATEAFTSRFTGASESEGGLQGTLQTRYAGGLLGAIINSDAIPFWGYGIGMGTNVGSVLLTGKTQFLVAEGEWGRLIGELGLLMGLIVIIIRLMVTGKIALASFRNLLLGDFLPWIMLSYCLITLPQAQWSQPTALGFSIFAAGITVAALRLSKNTDDVNNQVNTSRNSIQQPSK